MPNVSFRYSEEALNELDEVAEEHGLSRAEYIRKALEEQRSDDEVDPELVELREENEELRTENERLRNEKRQILEQREENRELVEYVEREKTLQERQEERGQAPAWQRAKWWLLGNPKS